MFDIFREWLDLSRGIYRFYVWIFGLWRLNTSVSLTPPTSLPASGSISLWLWKQRSTADCLDSNNHDNYITEFTNYERGEYFAVKLNMDQKTFLSHFYIRPLYLKCVLGPGASLTTQWRSSSSPSSTSLLRDSPLMLATVSRTLPQTQAIKLLVYKLNTHKIFWALKQEVQKYFRFLIAREH